MATGETVQTTGAVTKKPLYLLPKFTDARWKDGMYDAEHKKVVSSMNIREDDLLTFDQRAEVETRSLIFQYQLKYAEKEYELLRKEFQSIEARLSQREATVAEPDEHEFVKPVDPVKPPGKNPAKSGKNRTTSNSESGTDDKEASAEEPAIVEDGKSNKNRNKKAKKPAKSKSGSDTDKELTSSTEESNRRSARLGKKNK